MTPLLLTIVLAVVAAALWLLARRVKQSMLQPGKVQSVLHAHYQELLVARQLDSAHTFQVDFVFSAPTDEAAQALREKLKAAGWKVSSQREAEELVVNAARELPLSEINFPRVRDLFVREAAGTGCQYLGPGAKGLALAGINLPQ